MCLNVQYYSINLETFQLLNSKSLHKKTGNQAFAEIKKKNAIQDMLIT